MTSKEKVKQKLNNRYYFSCCKITIYYLCNAMKTKECINYITDWLSNYSKDSKTKGFVVGISGGIDSAVTSTLAAKTGLNILCLEMPIHQEINQVDRAKEHINWLKVNFKNVSSLSKELSETYDCFKKLFVKISKGINTK